MTATAATHGLHQRIFGLPAALVLTGPPLFWAGNIVVARGLASILPPVGLTFFRWTIAAAILACFAGRQIWIERATIRSEWQRFLFYAPLGTFGVNVPFYMGLHTTTAVNAAILNALAPIIMVAVSFAVLRERIALLQGVGVAAAIFGVFAIESRGDLQNLIAFAFHRGDGLILGSLFSWSLYSVLLRRRGTRLSTVPFVFCLSVGAAVLLLPALVWEMASGQYVPATAHAWGAIAYIVLLPTIASYILWNTGVAAVGPNVTSFFQYLIPVFATVLAVIFLEESVVAYQIGGAALIVIGLYLAVHKRRPPVAVGT